LSETKQTTYGTDHLYLTAFLCCLGHEITGTSSGTHRVSFEFLETPELLADVAGFMSGASICARQYSFEVLKLKRMLNGGKKTVKRVKHEGHYEFDFGETGSPRA